MLNTILDASSSSINIEPGSNYDADKTLVLQIKDLQSTSASKV